MRSCNDTNMPDVWFEAKALSRPRADAVPVLLASSQLSCGAARLKTMEAVVFRLLYAIDFQLAEAEVKGTIEK